MQRELVEESLRELVELKRTIKEFSRSKNIKTADPDAALSLENMYHYLKFRSIDSTLLQERLIKLGLSSLGRSHPHLLDSINQIIIVLAKLKRLHYKKNTPKLDYDKAYKILQNKLKIFGDVEEENYVELKTKIMITLPANAVYDENLIPLFYQSGADVFRINTAHDNLYAWEKMAGEIRSLEMQNMRKPKIYVDLAGPKIRTGRIHKVTEALKIGTKKDDYKVRLAVVGTHKEIDEVPTIHVETHFVESCQKGNIIKFQDMNDKKAELNVIEKTQEAVICTVRNKAFVDEGVFFKVKGEQIFTSVKKLPEITQEIRLFCGDIVKIGAKVDYSYLNESVEPKYKAYINCSNQELVQYVQVADRVFIDDGKIELKVVDVTLEELLCEVVRAKTNGTPLKEQKGINFPDTDIKLDALTAEDKQNLEQVVHFADIIGISFCQSKDDVEMLKELLEIYDKKEIAIVAKIETKKGVENLPEILEALILHKNSAVMIARGDLAIEVGFQNLSVIQEEILNLCEAAHMPIIYATQVLENMMKTNLPSRAEITDAGFAQRADCIMLNKGEYAHNAIVILKTILKSMHKLFRKNRQLLSAENIFKLNN